MKKSALWIMTCDLRLVRTKREKQERNYIEVKIRETEENIFCKMSLSYRFICDLNRRYASLQILKTLLKARHDKSIRNSTRDEFLGNCAARENG